MEISEIERTWQKVLRRRFPDVIVREVHHIPEEDDEPFLGVFMLPDDGGRGDFVKFCIDELWKIRAEEKLPDVNLLHYNVSQIKTWPRIWQEAQKELRAAKSTSRSTTPHARKPARSKLRDKKPAASRRTLTTVQ